MRSAPSHAECSAEPSARAGRGHAVVRAARFGLLLSLLLGCSRDDDARPATYYERKIAPILTGSCAASPTGSGCHVLSDDGRHALGNLSVGSYEELTYRRDLLIEYGPYGIPGLLLKVVPDFRINLTTWDSSEPILITTDIAHGGDRVIDFTSPSFTTLEQWIARGATVNNAETANESFSRGACAETLGSDPEFEADVEPDASDYELFARDVNPLLGTRCAAGNCHGLPSNTLYLTCGTTEEQKRWNYFAVRDYVSIDADASEIVRRVLAPSAGGTYHEGGTIFNSSSDPDYQKILEWARQKGGPTSPADDPEFRLFAERVQPMLVKRGCMMLGCHSVTMFHDYRLRGGAGGHFGLPATRRNYRLTLEQLALESPDPNASRLFRKNLPPEGGGILHRGGPLFAGDGRPEECDLEQAETGPLDEQRPYCVILAWFERERAKRMSALPPLEAIVYVRRPPRDGRHAPQDFEEFEPGAEVVRVEATLGDDGQITLGAEASLSALCGLDPQSTDARRPAVSWDGARVAFSARSGAAEPFRIHVVENGECGVESVIDAAPVDDQGMPVPTNGELVHNFDPAFTPDGRMVFVSTRGNIMNRAAFSYQGPQRTPADPSKLNANLYVLESGTIRQLTFLLNQEILPSFMRDGRIIFTTEKRAPGFYQLAGRRMNVDGGDYHPLFGQRPTIGYTQMTDIVELADKNFAAILSERGARHGAGALAIVNRSVGIDQASDEPSDYLVDPGAITFINERFFEHSQTLWDPAATGKLSGTNGAYQGPSPLPDGRMLVSYAAGVTDLASFSGGFDVVIADPLRPGERVPLLTGADDELWPVAVYGKSDVLGVFRSRIDEVNGAVLLDPSLDGRSEVTILDVPILASLLFQNTRSGRRVELGNILEVWESLPPEPGVTSFAAGGAYVTDDAYGSLYVRRAFLGQVKPYADGSAQMLLRGGVPIVLATDIRLAGDPGPLRHFQREEMQFYPNERARQSFPRPLFNGMCGGCHGSFDGAEVHVAANPDVLTHASAVEAFEREPTDLSATPTSPAQGPEFP
ncbi:MAG TPA: hypothetical protein VKY73_01885 [Polyangiaceae bacterium]|nr:hypothetical protein [Polyangiaceae bacterium]